MKLMKIFYYPLTLCMLNKKKFIKLTEKEFAFIYFLINQKDKSATKYNLLKSTQNIIDISNSIDGSNELSYVDGVHYSPHANKIIAEYIYYIILNF